MFYVRFLFVFLDVREMGFMKHRKIAFSTYCQQILVICDKITFTLTKQKRKDEKNYKQNEFSQMMLSLRCDLVELKDFTKTMGLLSEVQEIPIENSLQFLRFPI